MYNFKNNCFLSEISVIALFPNCHNNLVDRCMLLDISDVIDSVQDFKYSCHFQYCNQKVGHFKITIKLYFREAR